MIKVSIWNEYIQEQMDVKPDLLDLGHLPEDERKRIREEAAEIRRIHGGAIHHTLQEIVEEDPELKVVHILNYDMEEYGLTEEVLEDTDVLVWWSHAANERIPDAAAERVQKRVLNGMGFIPLHSACQCKPLLRLLGTTCSMRWRENDSGKMWKIAQNHQITAGIPDYVTLEREEMYGEFFDIPNPDELIFLSWYQGGEVVRSGCTWMRGQGKIFYFQPGHETNLSYFNPYIRKILRNAIHWAGPVMIGGGEQ